MMSRKDYVKFAAMMARLRKRGTSDKEAYTLVRARDVEDELIAIFIADNPEFKPERFRKACNGD
jgi:hypothetical protein